MRALCLILLVACGSEDAVAPESPPPTESPSAAASAAPSAAAIERGGGAHTPTDARINLSAGPAHPEFALVPRRPHWGGIEALLTFDREAVAASVDGVVSIFDVPSGRVRATRRLFRAGPIELAINDAHTRLFAMGASSEASGALEEAVVWDLARDAVWRAPWQESLEHGAMSPDGRIVVTARFFLGTKLTLHEVWGSRVHRLDIGEQVRHQPQLLFSSDSEHLFVVADRVYRFNVSSGRPEGEPWELSPRAKIAVRYPLIAVATGGAIQIRSLDDGEVQHELEAGDNVRGLAWSPDGTRLWARTRTRARLFSGEALAETQDIELGRLGAAEYVDLRAESLATLTASEHGFVYRSTAEGAEPFEVELEHARFAPLAFLRRGSHFLYAEASDVRIANTARRRARRVLSGRRGPEPFAVYGASVRPSGHGVQISDLEFGTPDGPTPVAPIAPNFPPLEDAIYISTSPDGRFVVAAADYDHPKLFLLVSGASDAIPLRLPTNVELACFEPAYEDSETVCNALAEFAPDGSGFILRAESDEHLHMVYNMSGRRLGISTTARAITWAPDGSWLVMRMADGGVRLTNPDLRTRSVVLRGRRGRASFFRFSEDNALFAVVRGAALVVYDVAANARKYAITMPARSRHRPRFIDDDSVVQVQLRDAFVWYSMRDGSELRRVDLDDIRGLNDARTTAVYCDQGRLLHRLLASDDATDLGPCPPAETPVGFDDARAWWSDGQLAQLIRLADGQRLVLGGVPGRSPLRYAYTPEGRFWISDPARLSAFRARPVGPILTADLTDLDAAAIAANLVEDFMAGRSLALE